MNRYAFLPMSCIWFEGVSWSISILEHYCSLSGVKSEGHMRFCLWHPPPYLTPISATHTQSELLSIFPRTQEALQFVTSTAGGYTARPSMLDQTERVTEILAVRWPWGHQAVRKPRSVCEEDHVGKPWVYRGTQPPNVLAPMDCKIKRGPEPGPPDKALPQIYGPQKLTTDKMFAVVSHGQVWGWTVHRHTPVTALKLRIDRDAVQSYCYDRVRQCIGASIFYFCWEFVHLDSMEITHLCSKSPRWSCPS